MELLSRDILSLSHDTTKFTDVRKDKTSVHWNKMSVKCTPSYLSEVMTSLWGYSIQSSALHSVFCDAKIRSLDFIFFFFVSINIYLCVWFSPQKCSNICSTIVVRNHYLLNAPPHPCGCPLAPGLPHSWMMCLPVFIPTSLSQLSYFTQHK